MRNLSEVGFRPGVIFAKQVNGSAAAAEPRGVGASHSDCDSHLFAFQFLLQSPSCMQSAAQVSAV